MNRRLIVLLVELFALMRAYIVYHCHTGDHGYPDWEDVIVMQNTRTPLAVDR